jgi:hypothetical protein
MKGQELKILFHDDKAYLTKDRFMTFDQLGLPEIAKTFKAPAYWTIRVINYIELERKIYCEILSYQNGETEFGQTQIHLANKLNSLDIIKFRSIDTSGLLKTMSGVTIVAYTPSRYVPVDRTEYNTLKEPFIQTLSETFFVPLKNVRFKLGGVSFDKKFQGHKEKLELTISNYDIREEFDAVKNYFGNVLGTKKIEVSAKIEIRDNNITSVEVSSPEISRINKQLIDNVKFEFVRSTFRKKINDKIDKSIFTMDEYFETFADEKLNSNPFYSDDKELLEDMLAISNTKHYKHLRFLSSKHSHDILKLRFVHKPVSFIFLIQGERNFHVVWETLNTEEATYVWHILKDINVLKMKLREIETIINLIKVEGKTAYISSTDDPFRRIYHDYSELVDGFVKWKGELESILT